MYLKVRYGSNLVAQIPEHDRDHLRTVPLPRLDVVFFTFLADGVQPEGRQLASLEVVEEKSKKPEVF